MGSAKERRRYTVTSSLIGWAHTQNDPWIYAIQVIIVIFIDLGVFHYTIGKLPV